MKLLKIIAVIFFDIIDLYYHQKRIIKFIRENNININFFFDIGSHMGTYSDLILKDFGKCKVLNKSFFFTNFFFISKTSRSKSLGTFLGEGFILCSSINLVSKNNGVLFFFERQYPIAY